jgi:hypothetical protein
MTKKKKDNFPVDESDEQNKSAELIKQEMERGNAEVLKQGNISLILDTYEDLFSDFDPRPYSNRAISHDFLSECKYASRDKKNGELELRLLIPITQRNKLYESIIKRRLKNHFIKHVHEKRKELLNIKREGSIWFVIGIFLIFMATLLYHNGLALKGNSLLYEFLFVLFEPAGWFTIWTGLEKIFLDTRKELPDLEFYEKMAKADIYFHSY